jgi:hypothetical protein
VIDRAFNDDNRARELARGTSPDVISDVGRQDLYWHLGTSYLRVGRLEPARDAFRYMSRLTPSNPDAYLGIANVHVTTGAFDEAAVALLQVLLLDNARVEASAALGGVYSQIDAAGCAVREADGQSQLDFQCPIVHDHLCRAFLGLAETFVAAKQSSVSMQSAETAITQHGCASEPFQRFVPH